MSKLSFCAYLVHQDWMQLLTGLRRTANYLSHLDVVSLEYNNFWSPTEVMISIFFEQLFMYGAHLICVLPLSALLYLAIEAPLVILLRTLFKKSKWFELK
jgi:peptidoglycan/LPS O-acetylase OafA/YrhL